MKKVLIVLSFFLLHQCSKPKTVMICGDHVCINKTEARQYFEENLSIEVKIIDKKKNEEVDLVELNLKNNSENNRKITVAVKKNTKKEVKVLTNSEINKIKKVIKNKENNKKKQSKKILVKKKSDKKTNFKKEDKLSKNINKQKIKKSTFNNGNKIVDVCAIINKCNIDEISKFLIKQGNKKAFPDITIRE